MHISTIICEYNPFHNGHKYQLEKVKERTDAVVSVMSGPFVQRGEAAITDKFTRAKMAAQNGADLVVELPVLYAMNTAQKFAWGAVRLIDKMNVADELVFGSECDDIDALYKAAELIVNEPYEVSKKINELVKSGISYPAAREKAYEGLILPDILNSPNNILAVEYIRAIIEQKASIKPVSIKREHTEEMISAHKIRQMYKNGEEIDKYVPDTDFKVYNTQMLDNAVLAKLRLMEEVDIEKINEVSEGLHNRIKRAALEHGEMDKVLEKIKTKRYPMSRIKRIMISALLGIEKGFEPEINYLRVLAIGEKGADILKQIKKNSELKIITKTADYKEKDPLFELDIKANDIFSLCKKEAGGQDFKISPYVLKR